MKKIVIIITIFLIGIKLHADTVSESLKQAQELLDRHKFASAFNLLVKADHQDSISAIQLAKEIIALQYFIKSYDHLKFSLRDLPDGEDIEKLQDSISILKDSTSPPVIFNFEIDSVFRKLIILDSNNCYLYKGLADYYYDISMRFDNWHIGHKELHELAIENYVSAIDKGCKDFKTYYNLGSLQLENNNIKLGLEAMQNAESLDTNNPDARYNLAYALIESGSKDSAFQHAEAAYSLYSDSISRADAARMLGDLYEFGGKDSTALYYLRKSDTLDINNYYTLKAMMTFFIKRNNPELYFATDRFFAIDPTNPGIYNDLAELYTKYAKTDKLLSFYQDKMKFKGFPTKVMASLEFYMARVYNQNGDKVNAKKYWTESRKHFTEVLNPGDQVFDIIDSALKKIDDGGN